MKESCLKQSSQDNRLRLRLYNFIKVGNLSQNSGI